MHAFVSMHDDELCLLPSVRRRRGCPENNYPDSRASLRWISEFDDGTRRASKHWFNYKSQTSSPAERILIEQLTTHAVRSTSFNRILRWCCNIQHTHETQHICEHQPACAWRNCVIVSTSVAVASLCCLPATKHLPRVMMTRDAMYTRKKHRRHDCVMFIRVCAFMICIDSADVCLHWKGSRFVMSMPLGISNIMCMARRALFCRHTIISYPSNKLTCNLL